MAAAGSIAGILMYIAVAVLDPVLIPTAGPTTADFLTAMGSTGAGRLNMVIHMLIAGAALLWLLGFLGLFRLLDPAGQRWIVRVGVLFGILACVITVQMVLVQGGVMVGMGRRFVAAPAEARELVLMVYSGLRIVDQSFDLAFDLFFFTAWILLASAMIRHASFGRLMGAGGLLLFGAAVVLNLYAAPRPPAFDVGPIAGLWVLMVYVLMFRATLTRESAREPAVPASMG